MTETSPCLSCNTSPCCSHLEIFTFPIRSAKDIDQAIYFSGFSNIDTLLASNWQCNVYFRSHCRNLTDGAGCKVHDQPEQPLVCVNYSPHGCFFKANMLDKESVKPNVIWMDNRRWQELLPALNFDAENRLQFPEWVNLCAFLGNMEYTPAKTYQETEPVNDAPYANWLMQRGREGVTQTGQSYTLDEYRNICSHCSSWCCTHLTVPIKTPTLFKDIDYIRYSLNFAGTQLVVSDQGWGLLVKTRCENLRDNRCTLYGKPERPQICRYYPEQDCYYRKTVAEPRPENYIRLAREEFELVPELFRFDSRGGLMQTPTVDQLRYAVEEKMAADAGIIASSSS